MNKKKIIALIPARSGSKGVVDKNLRKIGDKSLIEWAVDLGLSMKAIQEVYISTDSKAYESHAVSRGAKSLGLRSDAAANDTAKMSEVIIEFIEKYNEADDFIIVLLQPSSPFRSVREENEIEKACSSLSDDISYFSAAFVDEPHPFKTFQIDEMNQVQPLNDFSSLTQPRQTLPKYYMFDGAYYIFSKNFFLKHKAFITDSSRVIVSKEERVNIDSERDLSLAKLFYESKKD